MVTRGPSINSLPYINPSSDNSFVSPLPAPVLQNNNNTKCKKVETYETCKKTKIVDLDNLVSSSKETHDKMSTAIQSITSGRRVFKE